MPDPSWKIAIFYTFQTSGWTEVFYGTSPTPDALGTLTDLQVTNLLEPKFQGVILQSIRVSPILAPAKAGLFTYNKKQTPVSTSKSTPDVTGTALLCRLRTQNGQSRPLFLRGLRDEDVLRAKDGSSTPSTRLVNAFEDTYMSVVKAKNWQIQWINSPLVAGAAKCHISKIEQVSAGVAKVTMDQGTLPFAAGGGGPVIFSGAKQKQLPGLKGVFVATNYDQILTTFKIPYNLPAGQTTYAPTGASVRAWQANYDNIVDGKWQRFVTRDTGRPTSLPHGRGRKVLTHL